MDDQTRYVRDINVSASKPTALERLKDAWNDNPLVVIGVATGACMAVAKLIDAVSSAQGRRAYSKQVNMKTKRPRNLCNS